MWRPKGWHAREIAKSVKVGFDGSLFEAFIEAGADAMLEELARAGVAVNTTELSAMMIDENGKPCELLRMVNLARMKGWLVFIPDEA